MEGPTPMRLEQALDGLYAEADDDDDDDEFDVQLTVHRDEFLQ